MPVTNCWTDNDPVTLKKNAPWATPIPTSGIHRTVTPVTALLAMHSYLSPEIQAHIQKYSITDIICSQLQSMLILRRKKCCRFWTLVQLVLEWDMYNCWFYSSQTKCISFLSKFVHTSISSYTSCINYCACVFQLSHIIIICINSYYQVVTMWSDTEW